MDVFPPYHSAIITVSDVNSLASQSDNHFQARGSSAVALKLDIEIIV